MILSYERTFGRGLPVLPWREPRNARRSLNRRAAQRLLDFEARIRGAWLTDRPELTAFEALSSLDSSSRAALYPCAPSGGPSWLVHSTPGYTTEAPIPNQAALPRVRSYGMTRRTPFAEVPVALAPLMRATAKTEVVESVLLPLDAPQQLRIVLYEQGRASLFAGFYRQRAAPVFDEASHALLLAARPALRTWLRTTRALGPRPLGEGALATTLEALPSAALLVRRGRILYANAAGKTVFDATRAWLAAGRPPGFATTARLAPNGLTVDLVLPLAVEQAVAPALPPALARVAERLGRGEADKDIARALSLSLRTVRTYTSRIYQRLGVHGRRELMNLRRSC